MKKIRITVALIASIVMSSLSVTSANASDPKLYSSNRTWGRTSSGQVFWDDWELPYELHDRDIGQVGNMVIGYDTNWINEDYCKVYMVDHNHIASVYRQGGWKTESANGNPAVWAECWVRHTSSKVSYYAECIGAL